MSNLAEDAALKLVPRSIATATFDGLDVQVLYASVVYDWWRSLEK